MTTTETPGTTLLPAELREEIVKRTEADLLGPASGEFEELDLGSRRLRDRYLVGMLAPRDTVWATPGLDDDGGDEGEVGEGDASGRKAARPVLMPSSMGLSFALDPGVEALQVDVSWGAYERKSIDDGSGKLKRVWQRTPFSATLTVPLPADGSIEPVLVPGAAEVMVSGRVRTSSTGCRLVTLFLVNGQAAPEQNKDSAWLFQVWMGIGCSNGEAGFVGRAEALGNATLPPSGEARDLAMLDLQYRNNVEFVVGHNVGAHSTVSDSPRRAQRVETVWVPRAEVHRTEPPKNRSELAGVDLDMKALAECPASELASKLTPLAEGYGAWLTAQRQRLVDEPAEFDGHGDAADDALERAERVQAALSAGVKLIASDPVASAAFQFANRAMWQQRVRTESLELRRRDPELSVADALAAADHPGNRTWRPFQLAFVCLNAPSLTDPKHADRTANPLVDLLFFPTGGGKTEAYLGLVAYLFAVRRLQGKITVADGQVLDGSDGVAVFMRYTLRALTAQQFERAAALVTSCEVIRRTDPQRWGVVPFRLGMWVGSALAPNTRRAAKAAVEDARAGRRVSESNPLQLSACPWCGRELDLARDVDADNGWDRTLVYCPDPEGECPFTKAQAEGEGIPIVTVDEELYRLLPAFFIATVDKFAQVPWKGPVRMLFGRVSRRCSRHGYRSEALDEDLSDLSEADTHQSKVINGRAFGIDRTEQCDALRPPDLIIQDELHLITGPLGTMAGLYETVIDRMASWDLNGVRVRPKVVASTATIRRAEVQTWNVFERKVRVFPPPVLDNSDSFFAQQIPASVESPGRLYLGVCAHSRRLKEVENRVFSTVMAAAKAVYGLHGAAADPWMTTVGYFNAIRELAGMKRLSDDELRKRLVRAGNYPGLADRGGLRVEEMTSRIASSEIRPLLDELRIGFDPDRKDDLKPIDLLLATNMISVGVDVSRLGMMVAVGQPKSTAEYIQATSRVGRSTQGPGLVVTILNWTRPRDLSHYERFEHFHDTYYRQVEPLSVTPFAARALDRGLTAVLVGLLRGLREDWSQAHGAGVIDRNDPLVEEIITSIVARAEQVNPGNGIGQQVEALLKSRLDALAVEQSKGKAFLTYNKTGGTNRPLLKKPEAEPWGVWTCPMSMRSTEPNVNLLIERVDPVFGAGGAFTLPKPGDSVVTGLEAVPAVLDEIDPDADELAEVQQ